ncbi:MAG: PPC domain-containing DNA-binding protein [Candidatus Taylorbacteria bacterium]
MKLILEDDNYFVCRFDKGEEVMQGIADFCREREIGAGFFSAIGSVGELVLSYYNLENKKYEDRDFREKLEVTGVIGNVSLMKDLPLIHAHGTFSDKDMQVYGGHVKKLVVSATVEVMFTKLNGKIMREFNEETGLNLLQ